MLARRGISIQKPETCMQSFRRQKEECAAVTFIIRLERRRGNKLDNSPVVAADFVEFLIAARHEIETFRRRRRRP